MNKTLQKKLTEKHTESRQPLPAEGRGVFDSDLSLLQEAAKDLLQPRPQAIANILRIAKEL
jgi:hypothetical protein